MRIIAGAHKGRTLKVPTWTGLRPTSDSLRETLFNILAPRVPGARVLDAYAGTGAVALEALSRGAALAVCVEQDRRARALIEDNRARVGEEGRCMIVGSDARRALLSAIPGGPFDIVFLDPPYDAEGLDEVVKAGAAQRAEGGVLVLEHSSRRAAPAIDGTGPSRTVRAGDSALSFYS
ncbi:MAG: 16S rRNA (guanine(966)-N(2))-methyltransferase RsmD [Vicinamibacterales bacterium]